MKVRVHYKCGMVVIFIVPEDILVVDFIVMATKLGEIRKVEFL